MLVLVALYDVTKHILANQAIKLSRGLYIKNQKLKRYLSPYTQSLTRKWIRNGAKMVKRNCPIWKRTYKYTNELRKPETIRHLKKSQVASRKTHHKTPAVPLNKLFEADIWPSLLNECNPHYRYFFPASHRITKVAVFLYLKSWITMASFGNISLRAWERYSNEVTLVIKNSKIQIKRPNVYALVEFICCPQHEEHLRLRKNTATMWSPPR